MEQLNVKNVSTICDICTNDVSCEKNVSKDWLLKQPKCVKECGKGFVNVDGVCKPCSQSNCDECPASDQSKCNKCASPAYLTKDLQCTQDCGVHYYGKETPERTCVECTDANCLTCTPEKCLQKSVKTKWSFLMMYAKDNCPDSYYNDNGICKPCAQATCKTCSPTNNKKCTKCMDNFFLLANDCVKECPVGKFVNNDKECQNCPGNCDKCVDETKCSTCAKGFLLTHTNQCSDKCADGFVDVNGICKKMR